MKNKITTIAFDADDTLWVNEYYFHEAEKQFCELLKDFMPTDFISKELFKTEMQNLSNYGYGIKGFVLCMIKTANRISNFQVSAKTIGKIIKIGQNLLEKPIELLPGVKETLANLSTKYNLVVATKGDLLDQERKLQKSGLENYFHHIEIMSDKKEIDYKKLLKRINCKSEEFLMLGNSIKSDILPVLEIGGFAAHIPYHITWVHEQHEESFRNTNFIELKQIDAILEHL